MSVQEERKKHTTAALTTVAVNVLVFLILLFTAAWKNAGSGVGEYPGIEVNLGYDDQGSGDVQPKEPVGNPDATDTENSDTQEEDQPGDQQQTASTTPVEEDATSKIIQPNTVTDPNSDVEIKEEKKEVKPVDQSVPDKKEQKPVEKKVEEKPVVDQNALYKGKQSKTPTEADGKGKEGASGSEGDDVNKQGDKGVEGGTEGAAVYKGKPGGGDGGTLEINGWDWDFVPKPNVTDNSTGRIVFNIEVDDNGELIRYEKLSSGVSPAAERACIEALQKLTFTKKPGAKVPPVSKGRITFVIRAQ